MDNFFFSGIACSLSRIDILIISCVCTDDDPLHARLHDGIHQNLFEKMKKRREASSCPGKSVKCDFLILFSHQDVVKLLMACTSSSITFH